MIYKVINEKLHYKKLYIPFGNTLILTNNVFHSDCLDSYSSFRFYFTFKNKTKYREEHLLLEKVFL